MFKGYGSNIKPFDAAIRLILALLFSVFSLYIQNYYVLIISVFLFISAIKKFCPLYYLLNINEHFSNENYYLSFLPKHNPSAVFIFDLQGDVVFENLSAMIDFKYVDTVDDLGIEDYVGFIQHDQISDIQIKFHDKYYQVEIVGLSQEELLLAYFTDVTKIYELNDEIEHTQREVIYAMGEIGETRSKETGNHVKRVALYSYELAKLYGLSEAEANKLKMASPMHDIGKVGIPDAILNAPRKLTNDEYMTMQTHAEIGYSMLKNSTKPILQAAAIVAYEHHEKYDGSGYPKAKSARDIHIYARITAVADVFDALGSERVYKKAWPLDEILKYFNTQSGKHFDPKLIQLFMDNLDIFLYIKNQYRDTTD